MNLITMKFRICIREDLLSNYPNNIDLLLFRYSNEWIKWNGCS